MQFSGAVRLLSWNMSSQQSDLDLSPIYKKSKISCLQAVLMHFVLPERIIIWCTDNNAIHMMNITSINIIARQSSNNQKHKYGHTTDKCKVWPTDWHYQTSEGHSVHLWICFFRIHIQKVVIFQSVVILLPR